MREVRLYGALGKRFGRSFNLDVSSPREAIAALRANLDGFEAYMYQNSAPGYHVFVGKNNVGEDNLHVNSSRGVIKIVPVIAGAKKGGLFQTILGAILIAASLIIPVGPWTPYMQKIGIAMVVGGVMQMIFAPPKLENLEDAENTPSYAFNGPVNTVAQGNPVPICYGRMIVGSQVVSAGFSSEDIYIPPVAGSDGVAGTINSTVTSMDLDPLRTGTSEGETWNYYDRGYHAMRVTSAQSLKHGWRYSVTWTPRAGGPAMTKVLTWNTENGADGVTGYFKLPTPTITWSDPAFTYEVSETPNDGAAIQITSSPDGGYPEYNNFEASGGN